MPVNGVEAGASVQGIRLVALQPVPVTPNIDQKGAPGCAYTAQEQANIVSSRDERCSHALKKDV